MTDAAPPPAFDLLEQLTMPALVVVGDHDITDAQASYDILTTRLPDATGTRMPRTAHLPSVERPDDFLRLVTEWLGERHL